MILEKARQRGHDFVTHSNLWYSDLVIIIDEAQMSYDDNGLWLGLIKSVGGLNNGPRIALFSSYGSPTGGPSSALPGSPHVIIGAWQRVSLTPSIMKFSPNIGLFYSREEFDDVVSRVCSGRPSLPLDNTAYDYLFDFTNGHPGAVDGLLSYLKKICFISLSLICITSNSHLLV